MNKVCEKAFKSHILTGLQIGTWLAVGFCSELPELSTNLHQQENFIVTKKSGIMLALTLALSLGGSSVFAQNSNMSKKPKTTKTTTTTSSSTSTTKHHHHMNPFHRHHKKSKKSGGNSNMSNGNMSGNTNQ